MTDITDNTNSVLLPFYKIIRIDINYKFWEEKITCLEMSNLSTLQSAFSQRAKADQKTNLK